MKKFLIVKTSSLGDVIHTFPCLSYLRFKYPNARIDWVVEKTFAELLLAHPQVDKVHCIDSKTWRKSLFSAPSWKEMLHFCQSLREISYDAVFDLQGNIKSGAITACADALTKVGFGWKTVHEKPNLLFTRQRYNYPKGLNIREDNLFLLKGYFNDTAENKFNDKLLLNITEEQYRVVQGFTREMESRGGLKIMICPGSAWPNKQLTPEAWVDFLQRLQTTYACCYAFIWGSAQELELCQRLHAQFPCSTLFPKLSLPVLQNLMDRMDWVIAMDSLPLHLAGTTTVKTWSVFGASLGSKYQPQGEHHFSLQGICPYGRSFEKRCPILRSCPTGACIHHFTGSDLFESFKHLVLHKKI